MDLTYTAEDHAFRAEVQQFLKEKLPPELAAKIHHNKRLKREDYEYWHAALNARGWLAQHWPKQYGGTGWSAIQRHIFDEECARAGTPRILPFGVGMVAPVLIKFGTEEQKAHWLPRILDGSDWWCQGYSEPGAGSDLASLKTRAVRDGDNYVVNGQKTWTTLGQYANMIFCLVRTDPSAKQQEGISFLLIDMKSPGVTVRPIILLDGEHEVNEVFFDDVRVPAQNLVGRREQGLDLRQISPDLRAHGDRRNRRRQAVPAPFEEHCGAADEQWKAADRGPRLQAPHRRGRDRPDGAGNHQSARGGRGPGRRRAGRGKLDPENPRHRNPPGDQRPGCGARSGPTPCRSCRKPSTPAPMPSRSGQITPACWRRIISTAASCRSTAAPMKFKKTSSPR